MTGSLLPAPPPLPGRPLLVVTGFMGTGKTEAGRRAAELLDLPFLDLDSVIERRAGASVQEIFDREGEEGFRGRERDLLAEAARLSGAVVATGGGAPLDRDAFGALGRDAVVAVLIGEPEELARRLGPGEGRPLLRPDPDARVAQLLEERAEAYAAAGRPVDTAGRTPDDVARDLATRYRRAGPREPFLIEIPAAGDGTTVVVGPDALSWLGEEVRDRIPGVRAAAVVADREVEAVASRVGEGLAGAGVEVAATILVPPGEAAKTVETAAELWTRFREAGLDRSDVVVGVGGGAALDTAGFAAATYMRGVPLVSVPTTLLAMADAAVGGKVALDHADTKNLVGAFHHPRVVVADPSTLVGLPDRALRAGVAEVVKAAVLASPLALDAMEGISLDDPAGVTWAVEQAVRIKGAYVARDPEDRGLRHSLNLGHTFAHAIESATDHRVLHGEAVAIGLVAAARLGSARGITSPDLEDRLTEVLGALELPTEAPEGLDGDRLVRAMEGDKKRRAGRAVFVVPAPGGAALLDDVGADAALAALLP